MSQIVTKKISIEIITPEKLALKEEADFVVLPATEGEMGILPGHTHLLAQLTGGALRIQTQGQTKFFAVSGGFAEVHPERIEVFAETAEMAEEIDAERAKIDAAKAKEQLSKAVSPQDLANAQAALRRALVRLRVYEGMSRAQRKQR